MLNLKSFTEEIILSIKKIEFSKLDISEYNRNYIQNMFPHINYYFKIYAEAIIRLVNDSIPADYIVDFGGGHGFLSIFLKRLGFNVVYCDHNPLSVKAITLLKNEIGYGPDIIIEGSTSELLHYCKNNNILPKYLIATDLIEHVYDLNKLFSDLYTLNPDFSMVFTTGSVKSNLLKSIKLRKIMLKEEAEEYLPVRTQFIKEKYPQLNDHKIEKLAILTRGLIFPDIKKNVDFYIDTNILPNVEVDKYNTCDPRTGNWTERILSKKQYRKIIKNHFKINFANGFYNYERNNPFLSCTAKIVNSFMRHFNIFGSLFAPFMILTVKKKI